MGNLKTTTIKDDIRRLEIKGLLICSWTKEPER